MSRSGGTVHLAGGWHQQAFSMVPALLAACIPVRWATMATHLTRQHLRAVASVLLVTFVSRAPGYLSRVQSDTMLPGMAAARVHLVALETSARIWQLWNVKAARRALSAVSPAPHPAIAAMQAATARRWVLRVQA